MGLKSWLSSKLGMTEFREDQAKRLKTWEYSQINDWDLLDADPHKEDAQAAARLVDVSPEEGFARLLDIANRGSLYGMNHIAWCYWAGTGITKDIGQAEAWWRRAYEDGSDRGLLEYGALLVREGREEEAAKVYDAGWQRGFAPAVYRLVRMRLRPTLSLSERLTWKPSLQWAADAGHPAARYLLSKYLFRGWFGIGGIPQGARLVCEHIAAIFRDDDNRPIAA